jgi:hypothetical protein
MDFKCTDGRAHLVSAKSDLPSLLAGSSPRLGEQAEQQPKAEHIPPQLGVIIPLRSNNNVDVLERMSWKDIPPASNIEVIVVDDGSRNSDDVGRLCAARNWQYIYLETADAPFSLARARNAGIGASNATYVYFEDVDFLHQSNFYSRLIGFGRELEKSPFNFAAVPTIFLTAAASMKLVSSIADREAFDAHQSRQYK